MIYKKFKMEEQTQTQNMRTFVNHIGCNMSFEKGISEEQIKQRLEMFGDITNWREITNNGN